MGSLIYDPHHYVKIVKWKKYWKLKGLSGFDGIDGVSNESIQMSYGIELVETKEEEKMYKGCRKDAFENCMKKLGLEYKDIEFEKTLIGKNSYFKLIKILK